MGESVKKIKPAFEAGVEFVLNIFYPPRCVVCEKILPAGEQICEGCKSKLPYTGSRVCMKCGKPIDGDLEYCRDCTSKKHAFNRGVALWTYSPQLKASLYRFKYSNRRSYAVFYGRELAKRYGELIKHWKPDAIIPVPLHKSRLRERGYNQAQLIARELGRLVGVPVQANCVFRVRQTLAQKKLDDVERIKNIKGAFKINKSVLKLNKVIIIDDIFTTGSTVDEISRVLKGAGVREVYVIVLCIGRGY